MNKLIVLSGNIGVGKSTIGPHLAKLLKAEWLSETDITSQFPYLHLDNTKESKVIEQIVFPSLREAKILSTFLSGTNICVCERDRWDDNIFHDLWGGEYEVSFSNDFFRELEINLSNYPLKYDVFRIYLRCDKDIIKKRLINRNEVFESLHTESIIDKLHKKYESAFMKIDKSQALCLDVTGLDYSVASFQALSEKINLEIHGFLNSVS